MSAQHTFMRMLHIHSWCKNKGSASPPFPTVQALLERLEPAVELTNMALRRLVLRLRARCPASFPLRADTDSSALVSWLAQAGAVVGVSPALGALTQLYAEPLSVFAATGALASTSAPKEDNDRSLLEPLPRSPVAH